MSRLTFFILSILGIATEEGKVVVKYDYTAYGEIVEVYDNTNYELSKINPFRYKGYYYDEESKMYYVTCRYYNPELCRFIQATNISSLDSSSINGLNLYSYANNNPINILYNNYNIKKTIYNKIENSKFCGKIDIGYKTDFIIGGNNEKGYTKWPIFNSIEMTHYTTSLIKDPILSWVLGNISYTTTIQLNTSGTFFIHLTI